MVTQKRAFRILAVVVLATAPSSANAEGWFMKHFVPNELKPGHENFLRFPNPFPPAGDNTSHIQVFTPPSIRPDGVVLGGSSSGGSAGEPIGRARVVHNAHGLAFFVWENLEQRAPQFDRVPQPQPVPQPAFEAPAAPAAPAVPQPSGIGGFVEFQNPTPIPIRFSLRVAGNPNWEPKVIGPGQSFPISFSGALEIMLENGRGVMVGGILPPNTAQAFVIQNGVIDLIRVR